MVRVTDDTVCMCKEFREMEEGMCHCQLYVKTKDVDFTFITGAALFNLAVLNYATLT